MEVEEIDKALTLIQSFCKLLPRKPNRNEVVVGSYCPEELTDCANCILHEFCNCKYWKLSSPEEFYRILANRIIERKVSYEIHNLVDHMSKEDIELLFNFFEAKRKFCDNSVNSCFHCIFNSDELSTLERRDIKCLALAFSKRMLVRSYTL